jgi:hypothetical protein
MVMVMMVVRRLRISPWIVLLNLHVRWNGRAAVLFFSRRLIGISTLGTVSDDLMERETGSLAYSWWYTAIACATIAVRTGLGSPIVLARGLCVVLPALRWVLVVVVRIAHDDFTRHGFKEEMRVQDDKGNSRRAFHSETESDEIALG